MEERNQEEDAQVQNTDKVVVDSNDRNSDVQTEESVSKKSETADNDQSLEAVNEEISHKPVEKKTLTANNVVPEPVKEKPKIKEEPLRQQKHLQKTQAMLDSERKAEEEKRQKQLDAEEAARKAEEKRRKEEQKAKEAEEAKDTSEIDETLDTMEYEDTNDIAQSPSDTETSTEQTQMFDLPEQNANESTKTESSAQSKESKDSNNETQSDSLPNNTKAGQQKTSLQDHKKLFIGLGIGAGIVILILIITAMNWSSIKPYFWQTINLNDYVRISASGYDGYGIATAYLDEESLIEDINATNDVDPEIAAKTIIDAVDISLDKADHVSSGDIVTVIWNVYSSMLEDLPLNIQYSAMEGEVPKLKPMENFNVFDNVEISFSGVSPLGTASLTVLDNRLLESDFVIDKTERLANGDTITVTFTAPDDFAEMYGYDVEDMEATITVEGLPTYAEAFSDIADSPLSSLKTAAKDAGAKAFEDTSDTILSNQMFGKAYDTFERKSSSPKLAAAYFLTAKDIEGSSIVNQAKFVYALEGEISIPIEATTTETTTDTNNTETESESTEQITETQTGTAYYVITFNNLAVTENGNLESIPDPSTSAIYKSIESLYKENVTDQRTDNTVLVYDENMSVQ